MSKSNKLIIYFVPPEKIVNGGVLSIFSQCKETRRFYNLHQSEVVLCTYPGDNTYIKNDLFENNETVYSFDQIIKKWGTLEKALLHIPETAVRTVSKVLRQPSYSSYLKKIHDIHINVMTQNIDLVRSPLEFAELFRITPNITQTTAHERYATQELSNRYQTPVHHLSVFIDKDQYKSIPVSEKEDLIIYSPDDHPAKARVLEVLNSLDGFRTQEVRDLTYNEYKDLTTRAKFCITFGEGFDGYFIESYFSGSIGIAVYNDRFFPDKSFLELSSVFENYTQMTNSLRTVILSLNDEKSFKLCVENGKSRIEKLYDYNIYLKKMENFYKDRYDILPQPGGSNEMMVAILDSRENALKEREAFKMSFIGERAANTQIKAVLEEVLDSSSWKITEPLRKFLRRIKKP